MYIRTVLPNGVRISAERVGQIRSCSIGIWVLSGTRQEPKALNGISHFIEHMAFKGSSTHTAAQLAELTDEIGGQVNAFTTKECTCFYARVLDTHLRTAAAMLAEMLFDSRFDESDVETERGVILEEIGMYKDSPEDIASDSLTEAVYAGTPLALPILGVSRTLKKLTGETMRNYMRKCYNGGSILVSLAGSFEDSDLEYITQLFSVAPAGSPAPSGLSTYKQANVRKRKSTEQNQLLLAFPGEPFNAATRFDTGIMSSILGGAMSSRLFRKLREESGLCYSVYTFGSSYTDTGVFGISTALTKDSEPEAFRLMASELKRFLDDGPTQDEVNRSREQRKANLLMALESTVSRMNNLARSELFGELLSPEEIIQRYDAVSVDSVTEAARRLLQFDKMSLVAVGKVRTEEEYAQLTSVFSRD